jgi:alpha-L-fucosidase
MLLNVGPDAEGEIPDRQETRLREIGLWYTANHEAIESVRPWHITKEQDTWFTQSKNGKYVYAFVNEPYWNWMEEKAFFFRSMVGNDATKISILGQNDVMMEYQVHRSPKPIFYVTEEGIFVNVVKAQRLNKTWRNPLVIRFEDVDLRK